MAFPVNETDCRLLYLDIYNGCSYSEKLNLFVKHHTEIDVCNTEVVRKKALETAEKQKLLSEFDKLKLLDSFEHWSSEEEEEFQNLKSEIDSLRFSLKKLVVPQQIEHLTGMIEEKEVVFYKIANTRYELLGLTKENFANRKASEFHVIKSFFKDKELNQPAFTEEETDNLENSYLTSLIDEYKEVNSLYNEKAFKKIAVCPFFLCWVCLVDGDVYSFWGKPIVRLSIYQLALSNKGGFYQQLVSEPEIIKPPEEFFSDLDSVIKHYDMQYSMLVGKRKQKSTN